MQERVNYVRMIRVVGAELDVRVFSRSTGPAEILLEAEPTQQPELKTINDSGTIVPLVN